MIFWRGLLCQEFNYLKGKSVRPAKEPNCQKIPFSVKTVIRENFPPTAVSRQAAGCSRGTGCGRSCSSAALCEEEARGAEVWQTPGTQGLPTAWQTLR